MLEIMGNLAVEHTGHRGKHDSTPWLDVGIFSEDQWTILMGKCLGSFSECKDMMYRIMSVHAKKRYSRWNR